MRLRKTADSTVEPVAVADFYDFARVDATADPSTALFPSLLKAARMRVETDTGLALTSQTWVGVMDRWPSTPAPDFRAPLQDRYAGGLAVSSLWWDGVRDGPIAMISGAGGVVTIPTRPFLSRTQIQVRQLDASFVTLDPTSYFIETSDYIGRICRIPGSTWLSPMTSLGGIEITFTAGFGTTAASVPQDLKTAVLMLASHWHETREPVTDGRFGPTPEHYRSIVNSWTSLRV